MTERATDAENRPSGRIQVLGDFQVLGALGEPVALPPSKKTRALLAYLACVGRAQRRERLCEMFWEIPDDPRGALRWSLSKIRQIVGGALEADRNCVQLRCTNFDIDSASLKGLNTGRIELASTDELERAAGAFRGSFLADLALPRCPEFEAWRVAMADQMELLQIRVLRALIERLEGEPSRALSYAHALQSLLQDDETLAEVIARLGQAARQAATGGSGEIEGDAFIVRADAAAEAHQPTYEAEGDPDKETDDFEEATAETPRTGGIDQSRLQVSVLAIDLVSPAQLFESFDPEAGLDQLEPVHRSIEAILAKYSATLLESGNGEVVAAFGVERGTEDHAFFACRAALEAKRIVESAGPAAVRLRAGIDTGEVVARRRSLAGTWDLTGAAPRQAKRLATGLARGAIAMTGRARSAAGGYVTAEALDHEHMPGLARDETAWELVGENKAQCRWHMRTQQYLDRLIGREVELYALCAAWKKAREGDGTAVGIVAEPGHGKSRLTHEFCGGEAATGVKVVECGALEPDSETSYLAIRKMVRSLCRIEANFTIDQARERLTRLARDLAIEAWHLPALEFLAELGSADEMWNSLPPGERLRRASEAVKGLVGAMACEEPLILLFEDLHWVDGESNAVFHKLADAVADLPVLLIATYRPSYEAGWLSRTHCQQIRLNRFSASEMKEIVDTLVGDDDSLASLRHALVRQADGSPLFVEEAVRSLSDNGQITGRPGAFRASGPVDDLSIPSTIQSVISARIGRLEPAQRSLLQIASVIGKDVPDGLLRKMSPLGRDEHRQALLGLLDGEFLFEVQSYPFVEYTMKHALTRRVAYEMLLIQDRVALHRKVLELLEKRHAQDLDSQAEKLARHAIAAREWTRAAPYSIKATRKAMALSNTALARRWIDKAHLAASQATVSPQSRQWAADIASLERRLGAAPEAEDGMMTINAGN